MSIQIRLLKDTELSLANDFFNKSYQTNRSFEAFEWEFVKSPKGKAIYVAAFDTNKTPEEVIGIQCAIPLDFKTSDNILLRTAKSEDTLVNPNYRGQDIFGKMYALLFEECSKCGIKYIWGFTPAYKPFQKLGFSLDFKSNQGLFVANIHGSFNFLKNLNPKNKVIDTLKILGLCIFSKLKTAVSIPIKKTNLACKEIPHFTSNFLLSNQYFEHSSSNQLFLHQDEAYLKWRILENKYANNYSCFEYTLQNEICAHVIINRINSVGYIEQLLFSNNLSNKHKLSIIKSTIEQLLKQKVSCIRFLAFDYNETNKVEYQLLKKIGFVMIKRGNWFVWKSTSNDTTYKSQDVFISRLFTQGNA